MRDEEVSLFCHSERSEESLFGSVVLYSGEYEMLRQPVGFLSMTRIECGTRRCICFVILSAAKNLFSVLSEDWYC